MDGVTALVSHLIVPSELTDDDLSWIETQTGAVAVRACGVGRGGRFYPGIVDSETLLNECRRLGFVEATA